MIKEITYMFDLNKFETIRVGAPAWGSTVQNISWKKDPNTGIAYIAIELANKTTRCFPERVILQFVEAD